MTRSGRYTVALVLNLVLVGGLVSVGVNAHSLGVLAAGADYLADAVAIGLALVALRLADRHPVANALAALTNAGSLFVLSVLIVAGAIDRLVAGTPIVHGLPVLIVSGIASVAMIFTALVLGVQIDPTENDGDEELSHRAVVLDTVADAASAAGVAVTGAIIWRIGSLYWLDPAVALAIALVISYQAFKLLRRVRIAVGAHRG